MITSTDWCLYKYRVDFAPEEDRTVVRKGMLRLHKATLGAYIFDGTVLYTSHRLPQVGSRFGYSFVISRIYYKIELSHFVDNSLIVSVRCFAQPLEFFSQRKGDEAQIKINIRLVGDMTKGDEHYLQFFNIIMRKCLEYLQLQLVGRNFFDARNKVIFFSYYFVKAVGRILT